MKRLMVKLLGPIDIVLSLLVSTLASLLVVAAVSLNLGRGKKRPVLVSITRFADTIGLHRAVNSPEMLELFYTRPWVSYSIMLCVGNGRDRPRRLGRRVIGVDIPIPSFGGLDRARTIHAVRDIVAMIVTLRFLIRRKVAVLETMSPSFLLWRASCLRLLLPITMVTQIRGNLDLIYAANQPQNASLWQRFLATSTMMRVKFVAQMFYRTCDLVIGYNIDNMKSGIANGAHPNKTYLSRIRVDRSMMAEPLVERSQLEDFPSQGRVITLWSRLDFEKRVGEALAGAALVLADRPDVCLVVMGEGAHRKELEQQAARTPCSDRIFFLGHRDRKFIRKAAHFAEVVIVPYGGSSLVEAALMGKPVVAFDIEWHNELIQDGETGWLADYRSSEHLAGCLSDALDHPEESARRAAALRGLAERMFDDDRITREESRIMGTVFPRA